MISLNTEHEAFHLFYFLQFLLIEISEYLFPSISPVVTPVRSVESRILTEYLPVSPAREFVLVTAITVQKSIILWAWLKAITDPILEQNKHSLHYCLGSSGPSSLQTRVKSVWIIRKIFLQFWYLTLEGKFSFSKEA